VDEASLIESRFNDCGRLFVDWGNGSDGVSDSLATLFCDKCAIAPWSSDERGASWSDDMGWLLSCVSSNAEAMTM
jgi:hypothetical protein